MSVLRTLMAILALTVVTVPQARADNLVRHLAACAGRLSAEVENAWLMPNGTADALEVLRDDMVDLLDAVDTAQTATAVMAHRIDVKVAHRSLLNRAIFTTDKDDAAWARLRASDEVAICLKMMRGEWTTQAAEFTAQMPGPHLTTIGAPARRVPDSP